MKEELAASTVVGGISTALPASKEMSVSDWRLLFGKAITWLRTKQAEKNTAIYKEALRRESAGRPPRWE